MPNVSRKRTHRRKEGNTQARTRLRRSGAPYSSRHRSLPGEGCCGVSSSAAAPAAAGRGAPGSGRSPGTPHLHTAPLQAPLVPLARAGSDREGGTVDLQTSCRHRSPKFSPPPLPLIPDTSDSESPPATRKGTERRRAPSTRAALPLPPSGGAGPPSRRPPGRRAPGAGGGPPALSPQRQAGARPAERGAARPNRPRPTAAPGQPPPAPPERATPPPGRAPRCPPASAASRSPLGAGEGRGEERGLTWQSCLQYSVAACTAGSALSRSPVSSSSSRSRRRRSSSRSPPGLPLSCSASSSAIFAPRSVAYAAPPLSASASRPPSSLGSASRDYTMPRSGEGSRAGEDGRGGARAHSPSPAAQGSAGEGREREGGARASARHVTPRHAPSNGRVATWRRCPPSLRPVLAANGGGGGLGASLEPRRRRWRARGLGVRGLLPPGQLLLRGFEWGPSFLLCQVERS